MVELSSNSFEVAKARYLRDEGSWESRCRTIADKIASIEEEKDREYYADKFFDMLINLKALGGGRILRNAGYSNALLNCHVLQLGDTMKSTETTTGIGRFIDMALVLNSEGGGVGCRPNLRPKGSVIKTKGGQSTGLLSFLRAISSVLDTVESGGARRSGLLPILDVSHPELIDFMDSKLEEVSLNNFNISVGVTNAFLDAVEQKEKWTFTFGGQEYGTMWASDIFDKIISNMVKSGEPGIVNIDKMKINNTWYFSPIEALNLCGELPLSKNQSCCLGSLILPNFQDSSGRTKWSELSDTIKTLARFLDNVLDLNIYSFPEMRKASLLSRRIGVGVMGLADYLFNREARYGSNGGLASVEEIIRFVRNELYMSSIELAKERGPFPGFNDFAYSSAKFVKGLPAKIRMNIKKYGIRNATMMAFAPTGTTSLVADVVSGVEPLFAKAYIRSDNVGKREYIHPKYAQFLKEGIEVPKWYVDAYDLTPEDHFETAVMIQKLNDGSISKTQNLPAGTTPEQLREWVLEYSRDLVGITAYVDKSRKDQILRPLSEAQAKKYLKRRGDAAERPVGTDVGCDCG